MNFFISHRVVRSGFSLIELMVTIGIISLLSVITGVTVNNVRTSARDAKRMGDMRQLATALDLYSIDHGIYPPCPYSNSRDAEGGWYTCLVPALSPYMSSVPADAGPNYVGYVYQELNGIVILYFGLEKEQPNMGSANFSFFDGQYGVYIYKKYAGSPRGY